METDNQNCICPSSLEQNDFSSLPLLFAHLKRIVDDNLEHFCKITSKPVNKRFHDAFGRILETLEPMEKMAVYISHRVTIFDYSPEVKGNGYRSLLKLVEHCIRALTELTHYCQSHRERFYFRSHHYCLEIEAHTDLFVRTKEMLKYARTCMDESKEGRLFPDSIDSRVMIEAELMDRECFYGRALGFQFQPGLRQFLHMVCVAMASFAEGYHRHKTSPFACMTTSVLHSGKYTINPELRAKMIVKLTQKANMEFCKAFWSLTEGFGLQHFPLFVCPALKVNTLFHIPAEPFEIKNELGDVISIAPPCSWSGLAPVQVRLLSYEWREGQSKDGTTHQNNSKVKPKSKGLVLHIHGGGFVSQSSKSHEMYLRVWARELNVPIISVDYSLAPEAPFPRALEECFFAYAWALKNADKLGSTAQYFCVAGDSAGGNLSVAVCMRAAEYGLRRPDSLLTAYSPFNIQYVPSPSRLLSLMDPLLPTGILSACLGAYAGLGKSPFNECMKTPANSALIAKQASSPVNIKPTSRSGSFLDIFKRGKDSRRSSASSPTTENLSGTSNGDSFHSCPSSPKFDTKVKNHVKGGSPTEPIHNHVIQHESAGHSHNDSEIEKCNSFNEESEWNHNADSQTLAREDRNHPHPHPHQKEDIGTSGKDHPDGHHGNRPPLSNQHAESKRLLKLNLKDHSEVYVAQQIYDPLGNEYGHTEMQYSRRSDDCHVVNVVDPSQSPSGVTMILPVEDQNLRIGTPPLEDDEAGGLGIFKARSMSEVSLPIAKNPYMSPLVAPDEMLATLPPIDIVACSLDPLLDDSIELARRLRSLGKEVEIYILENLPHGFLNFNLVCQEAKEGCDLCVACMKRTLMGKRKPDRIEIAPVY